MRTSDVELDFRIGGEISRTGEDCHLYERDASKRAADRIPEVNGNQDIPSFGHSRKK